MDISEYCGELEFSIIQFVFQLTNDIKEKIIKKKLFYHEQIRRYITQRIDFFFQPYQLKKAVLQTYKHEVFRTIQFKLQQTFRKHIIFHCS